MIHRWIADQEKTGMTVKQLERVAFIANLERPRCAEVRGIESPDPKVEPNPFVSIKGLPPKQCQRYVEIVALQLYLDRTGNIVEEDLINFESTWMPEAFARLPKPDQVIEPDEMPESDDVPGEAQFPVTALTETELQLQEEDDGKL